MPLSRLSSISLCLLLIMEAFNAFAQTPAPAPAPTPAPAPAATRLEQLDSTYLFNLRKFHGPVLLDYQHELERLKQQLIARNRPDDAKYVDAEIEYVKTLSTTTGILPYTSLIPPPPAPLDAATLDPRPRQKIIPEAALSLNAIEVSKSSFPMNDKSQGLPMGSAEWIVKSLPVGNYDVVMLFSCKTLEKPEVISLQFAGKEFKAPVPIERATGSDTDFRPYRIAKIVIDQAVSDGTFSIQGETPTTPHISIRSIFFIRRE